MNEIKINRFIQPRLAWIKEQLERTNLSPSQRRVLMNEKLRKLNESVSYYQQVLDDYPTDANGNPIQGDGREIRRKTIVNEF